MVNIWIIKVNNKIHHMGLMDFSTITGGILDILMAAKAKAVFKA